MICCLLVGFICGCEGGFEGKSWDDLFRGGGCGGVFRYGCGVDWGIGVVIGIRGFCIFWIGGGREGCIGRVVWGFSGLGRRGEFKIIIFIC